MPIRSRPSSIYVISAFLHLNKNSINTSMKINELTKLTKEQVFESLKADTEHDFSESTLQEIANGLASHNPDAPGSTYEDFQRWLQKA